MSNFKQSFIDYITTTFHHTDIPLFDPTNPISNFQFFSILEKKVGKPRGSGAANLVEMYKQYDSLQNGHTHELSMGLIIDDHKFIQGVSIKNILVIENPNKLNEQREELTTGLRELLCLHIGTILKEHKIKKHLATSILEEIAKASDDK